ncbi:DUF1963 domain-containing protein [Streptomyces sp. SID335]|nr:DUF1963 domain-containing protein [Streptomyces sp. SID335]NDZ89479.1 DUF1963 domain-containing protein [Streptomyces sp. SID10115]NEA05097.1 DUF1963 domain-containing protein [Streptomyces sp. SID10116]NEB47769.1 DUF1963 domain-containing protein [Streptomyces sp. SID339]NEB49113.1 DUF1963 domain-containing protein [Streptomyces sp. SID339]
MTDASMDRMNRFRTEAASQGLPSQEVEEWIRVARPAAYLAEGGGGPLVARIGGDPMLPHGVPRPSEHFVASVDLAVLPPDATDLPLPADGHLLLFSGTDMHGIGGPVPDAVLYVPAGAPTTRSPLEHSWRAPYRPRELRTLWHQPSAQMPESFALDRWGSFPEDEQFELADELSDAWAHVGGHRPAWALQIGGHPVSPQNDPVHYARDPEDAGPSAQDGTAHGEVADDWALLASWRCGEDVTELDSGVAHWVVRRRDVATRRFDRVHRYVEMA